MMIGSSTGKAMIRIAMPSMNIPSKSKAALMMSRITQGSLDKLNSASRSAFGICC